MPSATRPKKSKAVGGWSSPQPENWLRRFRFDIERVSKESVKRFWAYGFRGADLVVGCYGPAVGEFGKHEIIALLAAR